MPGEPHRFEVGERPMLRGEVAVPAGDAGEAPPIVLCHGITATRRYVVHGSRALERAGHRVVSYDARGHGESDPAPEGEGYGYDRLVDDLEAVVAAEVGEERFVLAGHSMGAHTAIAYALRRPERLAGLVAIGPVYDGGITDEGLAYWDGLTAALEREGIDGFVAYIGREQGIEPSWRETVVRFTRERMLLHRHLDALAVALREVPRSRPFGTLDDLGAIEVPTLVVASHDGPDPGHPRAVAEAYAAAIPAAHSIGEAEGESPLAWQGGKLSRAIAEFCAEQEVAARR